MTISVHAALPRPGSGLTFHYVNWKMEPHTYFVQPLSVEFGPYTEQGVNNEAKNWVLHAHVLQRDGVDRPGRRTFLLSKIEEVAA